jgi:ketosteroid isomerase-like protein
MKMKMTLTCVFAALVLASAAWSQSTEKAIAALEEQWLQAQKTNNPDLLAPLLADKFINTSMHGKVTNKTETLATYKSTKWTVAEIQDVKVTVFGDTAIATGAFVGKGADSGKPIDIHERWTDTWLKMPGGNWQCVASQGSPIRK